MLGLLQKHILAAQWGHRALPCELPFSPGCCYGRAACPQAAARWRFYALLFAMLSCATLFADSAEVHVVERVSLDGVVGEQLSDTMLYTGQSYFTEAAPKIGGYIFIGWTTSATEGFTQRDVFGRAFDSAPYFLYDAITLTANYISEDTDTDNDGMPDGHELYWYGSLDVSAQSDTDNDGATFAQEIQYGTNPLFLDRSLVGVFGDASVKTPYNPNGYARYVFRSEPEGVLFATVTGYANGGFRDVHDGYGRSGMCRRRDDG